MKRILVPLAALTFGIRLALAAQPAAVAFYLFDGDTPVAAARFRRANSGKMTRNRMMRRGRKVSIVCPPGVHQKILLPALA